MSNNLQDFFSQDPCIFRARQVATLRPGQPALPNGAVLAARGRIQEVGPWPEMKSSWTGQVLDLGDVTLTPGLVNSHTHLELSHLGPPPFRGQGFTAWVAWLIAQPLEALTPEALGRAVAQIKDSGTAAVVDISSRKPGPCAQALADAGLEYLLAFEVLGHGEPPALPDMPDMPNGGDRARLALAGHALYSTSPKNLAWAKAWDTARHRPYSLHLAEHPDEVELLATGQGPFAELLRRRLLPKDWKAPGLSPVAYADSLGLLDSRTLAVHAVHLSDQDIVLLAKKKVTVCLCPRSNKLIGVGQARAKDLARAGVALCLGTDSLASVENLDLWAELRALVEAGQTLPGLEPNLAMLTRTPAKALGFSGLGFLAPGAKARFSVLPKDLEIALRD